MTVETTQTFSGPLAANGITTAFPFSFKAMGADEVSVIAYNASGGVVALPDHEVTLTDSGGTVTFNTPPTAGWSIWISSNPDFTQEIAFENGSRWLAEPVNEANDRAAVRSIYLRDQAARSLKVKLGETAPEFGASIDDFEGKAFGLSGGEVVPVSADSFTTTTEMQTLADATNADATAAHSDRLAADADAAATAADRVQTGLDRTSTSGYASAAAIATAAAGVYPTAAASNIPRGLTQASVGSITGGSGGTNGTFALTWSGGNFSINPTGTFTVSGGAITAVTITGPGLYIGSSPTVPTPGFAASSGLTGQSVALTAQFLVASGQGYWVQSPDGYTLLRYRNVSGAASADSGVGSIPNTALLDTLTLSSASAPLYPNQLQLTQITPDYYWRCDFTPPVKTSAPGLFSITGWIRCAGQSAIIRSMARSANITGIIFVDEAFNYVGKYQDVNAAAWTAVTVPSGAAWYSDTIYAADYPKEIYYGSGSAGPSTGGFAKSYYDNIAEIKRWRGKKLLARGDSVCDVGVAGPSWLVPAAKHLELANVVYKGVAGSTFAGWLSGGSGISSSDFTDVDIALLAYGINDAIANLTIGSIAGGTGASTYTGYAMAAVDQLLTWKPTMRVVLISPLNFKDSGTYYNPVAYADALHAVSSYYGVPLFDQTRVSGFGINTLATYTTDLKHPNAVGGAALAQSFARFLETI